MEIENTDSHIPSTSNTTATLTQNKQQKEPSKARLLPTLQAHPSFGKDYLVIIQPLKVRCLQRTLRGCMSKNTLNSIVFNEEKTPR